MSGSVRVGSVRAVRAVRFERFVCGSFGSVHAVRLAERFGSGRFMRFGQVLRFGSVHVTLRFIRFGSCGSCDSCDVAVHMVCV